MGLTDRANLVLNKEMPLKRVLLSTTPKLQFEISNMSRDLFPVYSNIALPKSIIVSLKFIEPIFSRLRDFNFIIFGNMMLISLSILQDDKLISAILLLPYNTYLQKSYTT